MRDKGVTKPHHTTFRSRLPKLMKAPQVKKQTLLPITRVHPREALNRCLLGTIRIPNPWMLVGRGLHGSVIFMERLKDGFTTSIMVGFIYRALTNLVFGFTTKRLAGFTPGRIFIRSFIGIQPPPGCMISPVRPSANFGTMRPAKQSLP